MDIPDALRLAPSADLYRLYLTIGRMINDPKRILEVRRHLHIGMTVGYVADDLTQPVRQGRILELRQTQAVVQDTTSGRHWILPYAAVLAEPTSAAQQPPHASPPPPARAQRADFRVGDTVSFTDQHMRERIGTIVRVNQKTASIECDPNEGHWRVSFALLRKVVDL
ncbi:hypothetical protein [Cupriavidus sp. UYPR2.512]|uniref:hypothetical protein n=1 Tax=Cupriavidus sp. UYPR2.512 TaxID=1080187 RepID=UPI0003699E8C|nr:hypothetical protein [Cupriavidus sp. UYPR2.512]UIF88107.1 hypothetical protein KAF44_19535 [Cupriavidus necator]